MSLKKPFLLLVLLQLIIGCSEDSNEISQLPGDPSNLQVSIELPSDGSIDVILAATGDNVVEFQFDMGDGSPVIMSTDGQLSYNYVSDGTYSIEIKAFGNTERFLREVRTVQIGQFNGIIDDTGYSTPIAYDNMTLLWNDEFDGDVLDETVWRYDLGTGSNGWGNNELQYYLKDNATVDQGYLIIEAKRESFGGRQYTSSRIKTEDNFDFQYGRVDIRARLPRGQGIWPALWMLGANFSTVGWPFSGEIDIMEMIGGGEGKDDVVHGTIHWDADGTKADFGGSTQLDNGIFYDEFHVFSIEWDANAIRWYLDDVQYHVVDITPSALSEFRADFFFIFNVAVGGNWPGSPNASTNFPQRMIVDYVRVFQPN